MSLSSRYRFGWFAAVHLALIADPVILFTAGKEVLRHGDAQPAGASNNNENKLQKRTGVSQEPSTSPSTRKKRTVSVDHAAVTDHGGQGAGENAAQRYATGAHVHLGKTTADDLQEEDGEPNGDDATDEPSSQHDQDLLLDTNFLQPNAYSPAPAAIPGVTVPPPVADMNHRPAPPRPSMRERLFGANPSPDRADGPTVLYEQYGDTLYPEEEEEHLDGRSVVPDGLRQDTGRTRRRRARPLDDGEPTDGEWPYTRIEDQESAVSCSDCWCPSCLTRWFGSGASRSTSFLDTGADETAGSHDTHATRKKHDGSEMGKKIDKLQHQSNKTEFANSNNATTKPATHASIHPSIHPSIHSSTRCKPIRSLRRCLSRVTR
ncbi:unnamed protein product [Amoebophrya sp. A120]|nr:unnamed protein product [Amoebophrya sp. A120]|eukprot:GSA120T00019563001.1